jgi:hypothetical protein
VQRAASNFAVLQFCVVVRRVCVERSTREKERKATRRVHLCVEGGTSLDHLTDLIINPKKKHLFCGFGQKVI